jgi:hypothetical protein
LYCLCAGPLQEAFRPAMAVKNGLTAKALCNKFLNFLAIHGGVLPFLNSIFGARFVPCETCSLSAFK